MYLILRDLLQEYNAVGGAFKNMLEWGSDLQHGIPLPTIDIAESLLNSTFDHNGRKTPIPFATETDIQGLLTMLASHWLPAATRRCSWTSARRGPPRSCRNWRSAWASPIPVKRRGRSAGIVDGDNSGSASLNWAAKPGASVEEIMSHVIMPAADTYYFPGGGNSVTFISPAAFRASPHAWPTARRTACSACCGTKPHRRPAGEIGRRAGEQLEHHLAAHLGGAQIRQHGRIHTVCPGRPFPHALATWTLRACSTGWT